MARQAPSPRPRPAACRAPGAVPCERPAVDTPIHCPLTEDNFDEILLHLPSSASLARAVATNPKLVRIVSRSGFLSRFRELHPSSPFMGVFVSDECHESLARPLFHPASSDAPDSDIAAVTRKGDIALTRLEGRRWRLRDCRNGVLLLSRDHDNSLWVYDPLSGGQPVPIQPCPDEGEFLSICLVGIEHQSGQRLAVDCFRVVSVQQQRHGREIRAVVYHSATLEWQRHPWASPLPWVKGIRKLTKKEMVPMYAASRIFWKYDQAFLLVLDTCTMGFSSCTLPYETAYEGYSIGEIEDGKCYLVCPQGLVGPNPRLQVWELDVDNAFKLKEEAPMSQVLGEDYSTRLCGVRTVTNGLAVLNNRSSRHHFVVDLWKMSLLAQFECRPGSGYPYQMPWPPIINSGSTHPPKDMSMDDGSARIQPMETDPRHDEPTLPMAGVFPSARCDEAIREDKSKSSNLPMNTKEDTEMLEQQYSDTTLGHLDDQMASPSSCSNPLVVESKIISTTTTRKNNPRVQYRKSSMGQLAKTQHKPLNIDASNCPQQGDPPKKSRRKEAAHTNGSRRTRSSHAVHEISNVEAVTTSMRAVRQSNPRATCRSSSMGRMATLEKPLCKRNNLVRVSNQRDEEPGGRRKKLKTNATSNACPEELVQHMPSPLSFNPRGAESKTSFTRAVPQNNRRVLSENISVGKKATTQHTRTNNEKSSRQVKDGSGEYKCNIQGCLSTFPWNYSLTRHLKEVHTQRGRFPCRKCHMKFSTEKVLNSHDDRIHKSREITLVCGLEGCIEKFPNKHELKIHEESSVHVELSTGEIKCLIKGCPKKYPTIRFQNRHYKRCHQKTSASRGGSGRPRKEKT